MLLWYFRFPGGHCQGLTIDRAIAMLCWIDRSVRGFLRAHSSSNLQAQTSSNHRVNQFSFTLHKRSHILHHFGRPPLGATRFRLGGTTYFLTPANSIHYKDASRPTLPASLFPNFFICCPNPDRPVLSFWYSADLRGMPSQAAALRIAR